MAVFADTNVAIQYGSGALCLVVIALLNVIQLISHNLLDRTVGRVPLQVQRWGLVTALSYATSFSIKCFGTTTMVRAIFVELFWSCGLMAACVVVSAVLYETTLNAFLALRSSLSDNLPQWPFTVTLSIICLSVILSEALSLSLNLRFYYIILLFSTSLFWLVAGVFVVYYCRRIILISQEKARSAGVQPPNLTGYYAFVCSMAILMGVVCAFQIMEIFAAFDDPDVPVFNQKEPVVFEFDVYVIFVVLACILLTVWPWKSLCPDNGSALEEIRSRSGTDEPTRNKGYKSSSV
eukprot:TRINITY_DN12582_c0_g1_i6.p1 TRINITY_DN12582_c0_g1~~TRINITY_DN12582_c0_g1_i6.p1  ORF type:complete len:293 (-),score=22.02 TRINITY_DN12582_c0_g1_i6:136-1014(-)